MAEKDTDPLVFSFFNEIGIIGQLSQTLFERLMPDGLKMAHFGVLNNFARLGGERNPAQLARAFQVSKGAMTNTLKRLEARGLIEVGPDPRDGRGKRVRITDEGLRVRHAAIRALAPAIRQIQAEFGSERFKNALPLLQALRTYLDEAREGTDR